MSITGLLFQPTMSECPYLEGMTAVSENLLVRSIADYDLEMLLGRGFRHFGAVFFRPICHHCRQCIPIRIPVQQFSPSKSVRRLFNRNKNFTVTFGEPVPPKAAFSLYSRHKKRFKRQPPESFENYCESFFHPFPFNRIFSVRDGTQLVCVSHLDVTANAMSAIYCYFDERYSRFSPGKFAVYKEIEIAKEMGIKWLYLGFYIRENRHTNYKIQFKPNQLMIEDGKWIDYMEASGKILNPLTLPRFLPLIKY
jgi:arginyl-tRNA--protein-N-Asp/Glu arginylyltransferase